MHGSAVFRTSAAPQAQSQVQNLRQPWQVVPTSGQPSAVPTGHSYVPPISAPPGNAVGSPKVDARMLQLGGSFGAPVGAPVAHGLQQTPAAHLRGGDTWQHHGACMHPQQQHRAVSPIAQRPGQRQQSRTISPAPQARGAPVQMQTSLSMSRLVFQQEQPASGSSVALAVPTSAQQPLEMSRSPSLASAAIFTSSVVPSSSAASREASADGRTNTTVAPQSARTVSPGPGSRTARDLQGGAAEFRHGQQIVYDVQVHMANGQHEARDLQRLACRARSPSITKAARCRESGGGSVPRAARTNVGAVAVPVSAAPSFAPPVSPKQAGQFNGPAPTACCGWASPQNSPNISTRVPVNTGHSVSSELLRNDARRSDEACARPPSPSRAARPEVGEAWSRPRGAPAAVHHEREKPRKNDTSGRTGRQGNRTAALSAPWANNTRPQTMKRETSGRSEPVALEEVPGQAVEAIDESIMRELGNVKTEAEAVLRGGGRRNSEVQAQREAEREKEVEAARLMEEECRRVQGELSARERDLTSREQQLANREQDLTTNVRSREQKVLSREERVAEREEQLLSRTKRCAEREAEVADFGEQNKAAERELSTEKQRIMAMLKDAEDKIKKEDEKIKKRERAVEERELRWGEACKDAYVLKQCNTKPRFSPRGKDNQELQKQLEDQHNRTQEIKRKPSSWGADNSPGPQNENIHPDENVLA